MHELGLVIHISRTLQDVALEKQLTRIGAITLEIGEVSGIVPEYITDCWEYYRRKSELLKDSELIIETLPAVTLCEDCKATYATVEFGRQCPHCGSKETCLVTGNECSIKEMEAC